MNRNLKILGGCLALALALTACGHEHTPGPITADQDHHTYTCTDCGKEISGAHKLDEDNFCEGCNSSIYVEDDGSCNITTYDEHGSMKSDIYYDANGNVHTEIIYENEYDENGNEVSCKTYENGILIHETHYETIETDELHAHYITQSIDYDEDGRTVTIYADTMMNAQSVTVYDADGNVVTQTTYQYTKDEEDRILSCVCFIDGTIAEEYEGFVDAEDCFRYYYNRLYDNGELVEAYTYEYDINSEGLILGQLQYYNDVLNYECRYAVNEDGWTYLISETYYDADGTVTEEYNYDQDGNIIE